MVTRRQNKSTVSLVVVCLVIIAGRIADGQSPPMLDTIFPAGGQAGQSVDVAVTGALGQPGLVLHGNISGLQCETLEPARFRLTIPSDTPPGMYDLWATSEQGVSALRTFFIGNRPECVEVEPTDPTSMAMQVPLCSVVNGKIDKPGDTDSFQFQAKRGQRVVIECWSERIDSRLRAIVELFDASGKRVAVNRGYFGIDPLIDFRVPADGSYVVKVHDLVTSGSAEHYYRLDIDIGPRVAFCVPAVIESGKATRVEVYGWNLTDPANGSNATDPFDRVEVQIPASLAKPSWPLPVRWGPAAAVFSGFGYYFPGSHVSVPLGVTDVPVVVDGSANRSPDSAQSITVPCEVSGQFVEANEQDWYAFDACRGEVLYVEGLAQRLASPVDLEISVLDATGTRELARFGDEIRNLGGAAFPTHHLDSAGRWTAPTDGRFLLAVRNLRGGLVTDPRRIYRISVCREEPDFQLVAVSRSSGPAAVNVSRGGRELVDILAFRQRGCDGPIRIAARNLPHGFDCHDVWLGPGVDRATLVVAADRNSGVRAGELLLDAFVEENWLEGRATTAGPQVEVAKTEPAGSKNGRPVRAGTIVRAGTPNGWGRLASRIPLAVVGDSPLQITANAHEPLKHHLYDELQIKHSPGGMLDVAVDIERREPDHQAPVKLLGVGLPEWLNNQTAIIPAGRQKGYVSFYLPPTVPAGRYSFVIQAETTVPRPEKKAETVNVTVYSNPVTFDVLPAAFHVATDPFVPTRARRGETIQVRYTAQRQNGFLGKMHTELAVPGQVTDVPGLRGRGETFVGQTETGSLQIVVNDDAPLGPLPFLRLFTVGVVEDQPVHFGSSPLALEIVE